MLGAGHKLLAVEQKEVDVSPEGACQLNGSQHL